MDDKTRYCPQCSSKMIYEVRSIDVCYKDRRSTIDQIAWWCTQCDEAILLGLDLDTYEDALNTLKKEHVTCAETK
jgi:YgiT-type zinc finger domain-containing protein